MPLTKKGHEIMSAMKKQYGEEEGERIFYKSKNAGKITGVDEDDPGCSIKKKKKDEKITRTDPMGREMSSYEAGKRKTTERDPLGREMSSYEYKLFGPTSDSRRVLDAPSDCPLFNFGVPEFAGIVTVLGDARPVVSSLEMFDSTTLEDEGANVRFTDEGYLVANPRIARTGIQVYRGSECGRPDLPTVRVYRPEDSVFAPDAVHSYCHRPVTMDHPSKPVTADNWKKLSVGQTGDEVLRDGNTVRVPMVLMDSAAIKSFKDGERKELSVGYTCDIEWVAGTTPDGEPYDAVQKSIKANHVALVANARGGSQLRFGDRGDRHMPMQQVIVDGISVEMTDTAAQVVQRVITRLKEVADEFESKAKKAEEEKEEANCKKDSAIAERDTKMAAKDAEIATLKSQLKDSEMTPAKLNALVRVRSETIANARKLTGDSKVNFEEMTDEDIRRTVVDAKLGNTAKGWSDDLVATSFRTLVSLMPAGKTATADHSFAAGVHAFSRPGFVQDEDAREKAYNTYDQEIQDAWKPAAN